MSRQLQLPGDIPMIAIANPTIPSLNPILAILYAQFLAKRIWLEEFTFTAVYNTLAASAAGQQASMNIDPNIDFIALQQNLTAYTAAGTILANPDYLMEVQEKSGNNNWSDGPVHVANWTGQNRNSGSVSWDLPFCRYIRGNNTLTYKLTNNTATAARVDIALNGIRVSYNQVTREQLFGVPF